MEKVHENLFSSKTGDHPAGRAFRAGRELTINELGINKSTIYRRYPFYVEKSMGGILSRKRTRHKWNSIPEAHKQLVFDVAMGHPELLPGDLSRKNHR